MCNYTASDEIARCPNCGGQLLPVAETIEDRSSANNAPSPGGKYRVGYFFSLIIMVIHALWCSRVAFHLGELSEKPFRRNYPDYLPMLYPAEIAMVFSFAMWCVCIVSVVALIAMLVKSKWTKKMFAFTFPASCTLLIIMELWNIYLANAYELLAVFSHEQIYTWLIVAGWMVVGLIVQYFYQKYSQA
jgi:hypothetical protein